MNKDWTRISKDLGVAVIPEAFKSSYDLPDLYGGMIGSPESNQVAILVGIKEREVLFIEALCCLLHLIDRTIFQKIGVYDRQLFMDAIIDYIIEDLPQKIKVRLSDSFAKSFIESYRQRQNEYKDCNEGVDDPSNNIYLVYGKKISESSNLGNNAAMIYLASQFMITLVEHTRKLLDKSGVFN
ncbi:MAG: hypothetical protein WC805_03795 [Patescibacteria group bacterium]|jgi:hypothetical protein